MAEKEYEAIVEKIIEKGRHGPYAVARSDELSGTVTFSLTPKTWEEEFWPEPGSCVLLSQITKKRLGWRANRSQPVKPT